MMAYRYGRLLEANLSIAKVGHIIIRRIARLYPLYMTMFVLRLGYCGVGNQCDAEYAVFQQHPFVVALANLGMVQSWGLTISINSVTWSVSTEWAMYLAFPVLATLMLRRSCTGLILSILHIPLIVFGLHLLYRTAPLTDRGALDLCDGRLVFPLLRCCIGFTAGVVSQRLCHTSIGVLLLNRSFVCLFVVSLLTVTLVMGAPDFAVVAIFPLLTASLAVNPGKTRWLFANSMAFYAGVISYSIYLLHPHFPIDIVSLPLEGLRLYIPYQIWPGELSIFQIAINIAILLICSLSTYWFIERPGRELVLRRLPELMSSIRFPRSTFRHSFIEDHIGTRQGPLAAMNERLVGPGSARDLGRETLNS